MSNPNRVRLRAVVCCAALVLSPVIAGAQQADKAAEKPAKTAADRFGTRPILTDAQWQKLDAAVDRGLVFIAKQQSLDGSFPTEASGQPAVTALCVIAFLSRGHIPNEGPYGKQLVRALDYVLDAQALDGTLMVQRVDRIGIAHFEGNYNHAISGLMLGEAYGMAPATHQERMRTAIDLALRLTRQQQTRPKRNPRERGGWRYMRRFGVSDSDLSVTAWELMFLRSARNAEFDVPKEWIDEGMNYVRQTFSTDEGAFRYGLQGEDDYVSRGMAGAGIVALALGGDHNTDVAKKAGDYILRNGFERYNRSRHNEDRYHYSAYYCGQAMFQLGGDYWFNFFPGFLDVLAKNQNSDGSWAAESNMNDSKYGNVYSTALAVLALTPPYQLLPIYQR
ncbi:MAG: hypothetical protein WD648_09565 [Planctomycetaceae bacterium]